MNSPLRPCPGPFTPRNEWPWIIFCWAYALIGSAWLAWCVLGITEGRKHVIAEQSTIASWYASDKWECASRDYPVGTVLRVTYPVESWRYPCILVPVTSAGPSLTQYRNGRHIDLSRAAFEQLADPKVGLIEVSVEKE